MHLTTKKSDQALFYIHTNVEFYKKNNHNKSHVAANKRGMQHDDYEW